MCTSTGELMDEYQLPFLVQVAPADGRVRYCGCQGKATMKQSSGPSLELKSSPIL